MSSPDARIAFPLFAFAAALVCALLLSRLLFLPRLAGVRLHGETMYGSSLTRFYADLRDRVDAQEEARNHLVLPGRDPLSLFLRRLRRSDVSTALLFAAVARGAENAVRDRPDAVFLESFHYDAAGRTLALAGDVRHVGPRSMTVLAEFIETLQRIPFVDAVEHQRFLREEDASGAFHSPFSLLLRLRSSSVLP
ncbi:hypothetical protein A3H22_03575 [Candidatus Peribacteria bacterium RIFCSPLOWO2_12_FULL_55_15]|nr:MAG: hypothetical protein A2789_00900 [Candidatus Peribacteria bacterium RIFCSPHIGHO2_01_FULL_54_22]OGJ62191.1 MAG: hypothetical protein A3D12_00015 [Candidatus Peribacteria bacterium RIFCSPHIGHO2_02_FULL_55_24]OGJ63891.1 MAG: hypothetical protein A3E47_00670 [Candidatus Peribacteria bacterium RIFCSPHIGHO2_12_FULL_54_10]OGJ67161.1 MAG: hypothetical protein A2947_03135 [Candidatus Peribacteria bacterium RIFCSPLOWO2_01_FULL_54_110]OGJ69835.1 MAG: hypothetical protein A3H90_01700 [Candidatus Pe